MDTFSFPNHVPTHVYPKGDSFKFGKGYEASIAPIEPIQRRFTLHFNVMIWYRNPDSGVMDASIDAGNNALAFDQFYAAHLTHKAFTYVHPVFGSLTVRFASDAPFEMPKGIEGGSGATEGFDIVLVEQPL